MLKRGFRHSPETIEKMRASKLGNNNPNWGRKFGEEFRRGISERFSGEKHPLWGKRGKEHPRFGLKHTEETKRKISESRTGEKHPFWGKKFPCRAKRHWIPTDEQRLKISMSKRGENNPNYGRTDWIIAIRKRKKSETNIERIVREILLSWNIAFEKEYGIDSAGIVDYFIPRCNLAIECDGTYWHSLPSTIGRDIKKDRCLSELGIKLLRLPEAEILKNRSLVCNKPYNEIFN